MKRYVNGVLHTSWKYNTSSKCKLHATRCLCKKVGNAERLSKCHGSPKYNSNHGSPRSCSTTKNKSLALAQKRKLKFFLQKLFQEGFTKPCIDIFAPGIKKEDNLSKLTDFRTHDGFYSKAGSLKKSNLFSKCLEEPTVFEPKNRLGYVVIKESHKVDKSKSISVQDFKKVWDSKTFKSPKNRKKPRTNLRSWLYDLMLRYVIEPSVENLIPTLKSDGNLCELFDFRFKKENTDLKPIDYRIKPPITKEKSPSFRTNPSRSETKEKVNVAPDYTNNVIKNPFTQTVPTTNVSSISDQVEAQTPTFVKLALDNNRMVNTIIDADKGNLKPHIVKQSYKKTKQEANFFKEKLPRKVILKGGRVRVPNETIAQNNKEENKYIAEKGETKENISANDSNFSVKGFTQKEAGEGLSINSNPETTKKAKEENPVCERSKLEIDYMENVIEVKQIEPVSQENSVTNNNICPSSEMKPFTQKESIQHETKPQDKDTDLPIESSKPELNKTNIESQYTSNQSQLSNRLHSKVLLKEPVFRTTSPQPKISLTVDEINQIKSESREASKNIVKDSDKFADEIKVNKNSFDRGVGVDKGKLVNSVNSVELVTPQLKPDDTILPESNLYKTNTSVEDPINMKPHAVTFKTNDGECARFIKREINLNSEIKTSLIDLDTVLEEENASRTKSGVQRKRALSKQKLQNSHLKFFQDYEFSTKTVNELPEQYSKRTLLQLGTKSDNDRNTSSNPNNKISNKLIHSEIKRSVKTFKETKSKVMDKNILIPKVTDNSDKISLTESTVPKNENQQKLTASKITSKILNNSTMSEKNVGKDLTIIEIGKTSTDRKQEIENQNELRVEPTDSNISFGSELPNSPPLVGKENEIAHKNLSDKSILSDKANKNINVRGENVSRGPRYRTEPKVRVIRMKKAKVTNNDLLSDKQMAIENNKRQNLRTKALYKPKIVKGKSNFTLNSVAEKTENLKHILRSLEVSNGKESKPESANVQKCNAMILSKSTIKFKNSNPPNENLEIQTNTLIRKANNGYITEIINQSTQMLSRNDYQKIKTIDDEPTDSNKKASTSINEEKSGLKQTEFKDNENSGASCNKLYKTLEKKVGLNFNTKNKTSNVKDTDQTNLVIESRKKGTFNQNHYKDEPEAKLNINKCNIEASSNETLFRKESSNLQQNKTDKPHQQNSINNKIEEVLEKERFKATTSNLLSNINTLGQQRKTDNKFNENRFSEHDLSRKQNTLNEKTNIVKINQFKTQSISKKLESSDKAILETTSDDKKRSKVQEPIRQILETQLTIERPDKKAHAQKSTRTIIDRDKDFIADESKIINSKKLSQTIKPADSVRDVRTTNTQQYRTNQIKYSSNLNKTLVNAGSANNPTNENTSNFKNIKKENMNKTSDLGNQVANVTSQKITMNVLKNNVKIGPNQNQTSKMKVINSPQKLEENKQKSRSQSLLNKDRPNTDMKTNNRPGSR